jgi:hypothetical protein
MRYRSYHREIEKATAQVLDVLNDIIIDRRNPAGDVQQLISVPCVYGSRSRILKSLENRDKNVKLPLLVLNMSGISKDIQRVHSTHDGLLYQDSSTYNYLKNTPVPVNISYTIDVITKFQQDMDMIISNFIPFFNPDIYVVIPHPVNANQNLKVQFVWDGNINLELPEAVGKNESARIIASTSFIVKTWIFPGMDTDSGDGNLIKRINFNPSIGYDENGIGRLQGWYAVPTYDYETGYGEYSFNKFMSGIICGYVAPRYSDQLQISAGISGYWHDISGMCTGDTLGINISGDPSYLTTTEGGLLFVSDHNYISEGMSEMSLQDYVDYYNSTISGELSGYTGVYN